LGVTGVDLMTVEIDYAEATFRHKGQDYQAIGGVTHNTASEDVGIGEYEYWGCREYDSKVVEVSEFAEARFGDIDIYPVGSDTPLSDVSPALLEAAQEALFNKTCDLAEEKALEAA
jgi:hypothetical protein